MPAPKRRRTSARRGKHAAKWFRTLALPVVALALVAAACSDDGGDSCDGGSASASGAEECTSDITVGVALDVGGIGDNGFNDLSKIGLDKAINDGIVCESQHEVPRGELRGHEPGREHASLADDGYDLVIGTGFAFTPGINAIAPDYPDTDFGIIDGYATCGTASGRQRRRCASRTSPTSPSRRSKARSWSGSRRR